MDSVATHEEKPKGWSYLERRTVRGEYDWDLESYQSAGYKKKKCYLSNPQIISQIKEYAVEVAGDGFKTIYIEELTPGT